MSVIQYLEKWGEAEWAKVKTMFGPILADAAQKGVTDLEQRAIQAVAGIAANPGELTDAAQRDAAVKSLDDGLKADGLKLGDDTLVAAVAAARVKAATVQPAAEPTIPVTTPQPAA